MIDRNVPKPLIWTASAEAILGLGDLPRDGLPNSFQSLDGDDTAPGEAR